MLYREPLHRIPFGDFGRIKHPLSGLDGFTEVRSGNDEVVFLVPGDDGNDDNAVFKPERGRTLDPNRDSHSPLLCAPRHGKDAGTNIADNSVFVPCPASGREGARV